MTQFAALAALKMFRWQIVTVRGVRTDACEVIA